MTVGVGGYGAPRVFKRRRRSCKSAENALLAGFIKPSRGDSAAIAGVAGVAA
jgi:hypothetical protein